jgi:hypothetical protein
LRTEPAQRRVRFPTGARDFSLRRVHIGSGAH